MSEFKARPTIYKGIKMRSRLEAGFAGWLDRVGLVWEYEPHAVGDEHGQYLPDFLVRQVLNLWDDRPPADLYIEVKPNWQAIDWPKMQRASVQLPAHLAIVTPDGPPVVMSPGGTLRMVWCLSTSDDPTPVLVAALDEVPFERDWWT